MTTSNAKIDAIRRDYMLRSLSQTDMDSNPIDMFSKWFDDAVTAAIPDVNAMSLATCGDNGQPTSRVVLLKGVENDGFVFYTNYESAKGKEMAENNRVGLCFYWTELERQVRIDGVVEKVSREASEKYFKSRPYESQVGAWASHQSKVVQSREQLEAQFKDMLQEYPEQNGVPLPPFWGGYIVKPTRFEFWQGRASRLHDRFEYALSEQKWVLSRLSP
jgi:pyridoxamine 5'-phosphate oxidase